jgi:hypothetical protein
VKPDGNKHDHNDDKNKHPMNAVHCYPRFNLQ